MEPLLFSVPEYAARTGLTERQTLELGYSGRLPLFFLFDGLAIDSNDGWLRNNGTEHWRALRELEQLQLRSVAAKSNLRAAEQGERQEHLEELRSIERQTSELNTRIEQREIDRRSCRYLGLLRAPPETLRMIANSGEAPHPSFAYHPLTPCNILMVDGTLVLEGRIMALDPGASDDL